MSLHLKNPVIRLADLDGDDDLDLLFGSKVQDPRATQLGSVVDGSHKLTAFKYDKEEKRMIRVDREGKTENSLANQKIEFITDMQTGFINNDDYLDIIINRYQNDGSNDLFYSKGNAPVSGGSSNLNEETLVFNSQNIGSGLFKSIVKISDLNNDGQVEVIQLGLTSDNSTSGIPKIIIYTYNDVSDSFERLVIISL